jgi:hypothetical protein
MPDHEKAIANGRAESAEERRARQAAENVATWEAAFAATRAQTGAASERDPDRANAGALVSRAHREEKTSGSSPHGVAPDDRSAGRAK